MIAMGLVTGAFAWMSGDRPGGDAEERFRIKYGRSYPSTEQARASKEAKNKKENRSVVAEKEKSTQPSEADKKGPQAGEN